jgi:DNA-binding NtrC family response regulator
MIINSTNSVVRILVADDDDENRNTLAALIRRFHYECDEAADAYHAAELLCENNYHLVIADIHMPGNCSLELLDAADEIAPGVPFILVTAASTRETAMCAVGTQVSAYLEKPVHADQLRTAVEDALLERVDLEAPHRELMQEVVRVLAETRQNFKSRRLAALRSKVESALSGGVQQTQTSSTAAA